MLPEGEVRRTAVVTNIEQRDHPRSVHAPACIKFVLSEVAYYRFNIGCHILLKLLGLIGRKVSFDTFHTIYYVVSCVLAEMCRLQPFRCDKYADLVKEVSCSPNVCTMLLTCSTSSSSSSCSSFSTKGSTQLVRDTSITF